MKRFIQTELERHGKNYKVIDGNKRDLLSSANMINLSDSDRTILILQNLHQEDKNNINRKTV